MLRRLRVPARLLTSLLAGTFLVACSTGSTAPPTSPTPAPVPSTGCQPPPTAASCGGATQPPAFTAAPTDAGTPVASPQREPGTTRTGSRGAEQVWVPGGIFTIGSEPDSATAPPWARTAFASEHPAHKVAISRGYWIDKTEVTVAAYAEFVAATGYENQSLWSTDGWAWRQSQGTAELPRACVADGQEPTEPQVCVSWYEAEAFAAWRGGRLPTEAEWEFAARGPESFVYPWGDAYDPALANLDGGTGPVAVGSYPDGASWVGALDMAGNAMEWVADWYGATYYREQVRDDPLGPETGRIKMEKGGWWGAPDDTGEFIGRSSFRLDEDPPTYSDHHIGFRIVSPD